VKIDRPNVQIPLARNAFIGGRTELTLADVQVNAVCDDCAVVNTPAGDDLARKALLKKVREMRFTKDE